MTLHKLTAGDGYTYLTRQVAAADATNRGYGDLAGYYAEKGEAPGVWMGSGLSSVPEFPRPGEPVTEAQMIALFGEGRNPNADAIERAALAAGATPVQVDAASRLGSPYRVYEQANMFHRRCAGAFRDYNTARGRDGDTPVPAEVRAQLRSDIAATMFTETYGRTPMDARELSGHLARVSRQATTAVAGYDLTFSPVKSVSTLWAIAPREVAERIEAAHADAVADTMRWLERHAAFTRRGKGGVAQVEVTGLIAAAFTHRDSRAGDPDLHTHVAVSNKVRATSDGRWLALDGRALFKNNVTASERYNTRLEALLVERLGVRFAERPSTDPGKRPVREIVGIDGDLPRAWSRRRAAIEDRRAELSARFQAEHGRPPTVNEARELAQQANLETRDRKHDPRAYAEQRASWRAEALAVLGGERELRDYVQRALRHPWHREPRQRITTTWTHQTAREVLETVQSARAVWQENHVRAETERRVRAAGTRAADLDRAVDAIVTHVLSPALSLPLDSAEHGVDAVVAPPAALRRSDGSSVYTVAGSALFTSAEIVTAEQAIVAAAARTDGRRIDADTVGLALLESTANGVELNPDQAHLVRQLATSGARVQLALAPAGTGKTTAMRVLSRAWRSDGGTVLGLAPSAAAAAVLRGEIDATTDTLAKLIHALHADADVPDWVSRIGPDTLVVIDEAGMAGTPQLAEAIEHVIGRGGSVRLIGDDQQLAAIGSGGVLRDIAKTHGAVTLSQVVRFTDPATGAPNRAEGAASLALRDGDPAALAYYVDQRRIHVGDRSTVTDGAYTAWAADRAAGRDAILLAPTRDLVVDLNTRARADRLAAQPGTVGRQVRLADQTQASAGDAIITHRNNRMIAIGAHDWVKNGDRWTVGAVRESGALDVVHHDTGRHITLPADYVAAHVALGYAATVHAAQGITADTCHTVATGEESRQLLYVALTRGRHANHLYLTVAGDGDEHAVITRDALLPPTAVDVLSRVLARDGAPVSAASQARALADPATRLHTDAERYHHALNTAAVDYLTREPGTGALARIDAAAEAALPGLTGQEAYPTLRGHLALSAVAGHDPAELLRHALGAGRGLADARDMAAVLDWRLDPTGHHLAAGSHTAPLPWLPPIPDPLTTDAGWGRYLLACAGAVTSTADELAERIHAWTPTSAPAWAQTILDRDPGLVADLAIWRAAHDTPDTDPRPTGPSVPAAAEARAQRALDQRVTRLLGDPRAATRRWKPVADSIDKRIAADPYWPTLAGRLNTAARAGIDIANLVRAAGNASPLPDEQPAAALWWRLTLHLSPAATTATGRSVSDALRPDWVSDLVMIVGADTAGRVLADPAWPALVAAVNLASNPSRPDGWEPGQLLATAHDLLHGGQPDEAPLRPGELATALAWRIGLLTDTSDGDQQPAPIEEPPPDADELPTTPHDPTSDADWLAIPAEPGTGASGDDPIAAIHAELRAHDDARQAATAAEKQFWTGAAVPRERLVELNRLAEQFFTVPYPDSWAPDYLTGRLGTDLTDDARFSVGYAPDRWTALTDHLHRTGATDGEIVAAGLGRIASTGRVIDAFRDRLVFPITDVNTGGQREIHGWIARRNPATTGDQAGPKYLNTAETDLFCKGNELYGLAEAAPALTGGAAVVLVEGPLDAIAVTLAGNGNYVGVAPLGTAFTDTQADKLRPYIGTGKPDPIVATDTDPAGQQAAHRAFWQLAARNANPRHLTITDGKDPADMLQAAGPAALRDALSRAGSLADAVIAARLRPFADRLQTVEGRVHATRHAAEVIGALPPDHWTDHIDRLVERTGIAQQTAMNEVMDAVEVWTADPRDATRPHLAERRPHPHRPEPAPPARAPETKSGATPPAERWAALGNTVHAGLSEDPYWPALARSIDQAAEHGIDVHVLLPKLVEDSPLPNPRAARNLDFRLADAVRPSARRATPIHAEDESATRARRAAADHTPGTRRAPAQASAPRRAR